MKRFLLLIALVIFGVRLNAQNVGDNTIIDYDGYSLKFTVTNVEPAECEVICSIKPTEVRSSITVPSVVEINGSEFNVTKIGDYAFYECTKLRYVNLPSTITYIGDNAFVKSNILSIRCLAENVPEIGSDVFAGLYATNGGVEYPIQIQVPDISLELYKSVELWNEHRITKIYPYHYGEWIYEEYDGYELMFLFNPWYDGWEVQNSTYGYNDNGAPLIIPSTIMGYNVTALANAAFYDCDKIESIEIPSNIIHIGNYAFGNCNKLSSVAFEENSQLQTIGDYAFEYCKIKSIEIPSSVVYIGNSALKCPSLSSVIFKENSQLQTIGDYAFAYCELTSIEIPDNVVSIGGAFDHCLNLKNVSFGENSQLASIGTGAFRSCSVTNIEIPSSVSSIGHYAFESCSKLNSLTCYAENVPETGMSPFGACPSNMKIYVPVNSVEAYQATSPWNNYTIEAIAFPLAVGDETIIDYDGYSLKFTVTNVEPAECELVCSTYPTTETAITIPSTVEINGNEVSVTSIGDRAFAIYTTDGNGGYSFSQNPYLISVEIPSSVTSIASYAFYYCDNLIDIEIPSTLTFIGHRAFSGCMNLTSIAIPSSVASIASYAFYYCSNLTSVTFEENSQLNFIGDCAFRDCSQLTSIEIPDSVTSIGEDAFYCCLGLTNIIVQNGNTVYDSRNNSNAIIETASNTLIFGCKNTIIPNSVTSIGDGAFAGDSYRKNTELASMEIPSSVTSIGDGAFFECDGLTSIVLPSSITYIGSNAFYSCSNLTVCCYSEEVPETAATAFYECNSYMKIYVPANSVESYQATSPWNNYTIEAIAFPLAVGDETIVDYEGYSLKFTVTNLEPAECEVVCSTYPTTETAITIPSTVEINGNEVSVTSIGYFAFAIYTTDGSSYYNSENPYLISVEIPSSVTSIGANSFSYCSKLTSIEIPSSVTYIGTNSFSRCSHLTSITVESNNEFYDSRDNCNAIIETSSNTLLYGCENTIIPSGVTLIEDYAFEECENLTNIVIPNSVVYIGFCAFSGCHGLTNVIFEENSQLDSISKWAFSDCTGLTNISIPSSVVSIEDLTFGYCYSLTNIEIPSSVTSIGDHAFYYCSNLTIYCYSEDIPETSATAFEGCSSYMKIYVPAKSVEAYQAASPWNEYTIEALPNSIVEYGDYSLQFVVTSVANSECEVVCSQYPNVPIEITIPSTAIIDGKEYAVTSIGDNAFYNCDNLTSIEIPDNVVSIGNSAFGSCDALTYIEFPNSLKYLGEYAIQVCPNLKSIEIPASLTEIGGKNFVSCPGLESINVENGNPVYDSRNNCNAIIETSSNTLIAGCKTTIIPNDVTSIGFGAFAHCSGLISIVIPNSVNSISPCAFSWCENLENVVFEENSQLTHIGIDGIYPDSYGAFYECKKLTNIVIPESVKVIGVGTFINSGLADIKFGENSQLETIGLSAFYGCVNLTSIEMPNSIKLIDTRAFSQCSKLNTVICHAENVPDAKNDVFEGCPSNMLIKVPAVAIEAYKSSTPWNNYSIDIINHWIPNEALYANNLSLIGQIQIDEVDQNVTTLEIGAFCGDELRGSNRIQYIPELDKYLVFLTVYGEKGDNITFKLYDHILGEELNCLSPSAVQFQADATIGNILAPHIMNYRATLNVSAAVYPSNAGTIVGAGSYSLGATATLVATANEGYDFVNWTENGEVISEDNEFSFIITNDRNITANYTIRVEATVNPEGTAVVTGTGSYNYGEEVTLVATLNEGYDFVNWTKNGEVVSESSEYSFVLDEYINLVANTVLKVYDVATNVYPEGAGRASSNGNYTYGNEVTLVAEANAGFSFKNWTCNGEVVATDPSYSFIITQDVEYVANFNYVQTRFLDSGWNWYSSYIDVSGEQGLDMMESSLGDKAIQIKNQTSFVKYEYDTWLGTLTQTSVEEMYMIHMSESSTLTMVGDIVNPSEYPINVRTNWNWISYYVKESMSVASALANFTPCNGDYIKSKSGFSQYYEGVGWIGALNTMIPGQGYMYQNVSGMPKTLVYPQSSAKEELIDNITSENNYWIFDVTKYADNMSIIAIVESDGKELQDYEIGAFCNGECRGSARPIYIEQLDKYMIFLTVNGNSNDVISFKYYDIYNEEEILLNAYSNIIFSENGTIGTISEPYLFNVGTVNVDELSYNNLEVYPNPVGRNNEIKLGNVCDKVEVYNTIGVMIMSYDNVDKIDGIGTSGVYMIRAINNKEVKNCRIVVE